MVEKVADVEQMLTIHFHSREKEQIEYVTEQLRLEQQQLYQLINIFEVILTLNKFFISFKGHRKYIFIWFKIGINLYSCFVNYNHKIILAKITVTIIMKNMDLKSSNIHKAYNFTISYYIMLLIIQNVVLTF